MSVSFKRAFGERDFLFVTLDALRFDVAIAALEGGDLPNLRSLLGLSGFARRHTPSTFTFPAHQAFFAGFFPTPVEPGPHKRPMALRFAGSRTIDAETLLLDGPCIVTAFARRGYRTICIGGTTFFNPKSELGTVLPSRFDEAHWTQEMGVASPHASRAQFGLARERLCAVPPGQRAFLFINASATHPPTRMFLPGAKEESPDTQRAALRELDRHLPPLIDALRARGGAVGIISSDHGTCFGEDGYTGHRLAHESVWTVPYGEVDLGPNPVAEASS